TKVHNKYEIVEVRATRRYNKAYDPFIFAQQAEQVYYTTYPEGHHGWLAVIKTKARSRIVNNTLPQIEQEASYQDDDFVGLQVVLHIDPDVINESLANIDGGGEEVDTQLLDQTKFDEPDEDEYITSESESRGVSRRGQPTINSPTSINHISTSESTIPIHQHAILPTVEEEPQPIEVGDIVVTPSTLQDSFTPKGPSPHSKHAVDQRPFLQVIDNEFTPSHGPAHVISRIIKQKFDEPWSSWKKVRLKVCDLSFREFKKWSQSCNLGFHPKGSCIYKNAMNKIRNGHKHFQNKRLIAKANRAIDKGALAYCGGSISTPAQYEKVATQLQRPPTAWEVVEKTKKLKSGEWVNDKTRELAEATFANGFNSVRINDNDIYLEVVGGKNEKWNAYRLGKLTNKFIRSTRISTNLIDISMVQQMEEMCETIHKLNNELVGKTVKEKSLEKKVVQLLHNEEQSGAIVA
ncbi:hypothetical protein CR513_29843, partial [Mucuna pruriens]